MTLPGYTLGYRPAPTARGMVLSDLHIGDNNSTFGAYVQRVKDTIAGKIDAQGTPVPPDRQKPLEHVVLLGDIFELFYTHNKKTRRHIDGAVRFLESLCEEFPDTHFDYVLGNHETVKDFVKAMKSLEQRTDNFSFHKHRARIGSGLFVHGDEQIDGKALKRVYVPAKKAWMGDTHNWLNAAIAEPGHRVVGAWRRKEWVVPKLYAMLEKSGRLRPETRHVFFGHTHTPFNNFAYRNILFHNMGATYRGARKPPGISLFEMHDDAISQVTPLDLQKEYNDVTASFRARVTAERAVEGRAVRGA